MLTRIFSRAALGLLAASLCASAALAQSTPISGLPAGSAFDGTELVPIVQGGTTRRATISQWTGYQTTALPVFTSSAKGFAPASGGGTTNFLRADGTWAAPPAGSGGTTYAPFGGSGTNHSSGLVPDPGATAGTSRYLREDGTFAVPPTGSGGGGISPDFYGYVPGAYYMADQTITGAAVTANTIRLHPVPIRQAATLSGLLVRISTTATGNVQGMCYASNPTTMKPTGAPVATSASVSTSVSGNISLPFTANYSVSSPTLLWCGTNTDNSTAVYASISNALGSVMSKTYGARSTADAWNAGSTAQTGLSYTGTFGTATDLTSATSTTVITLTIPAAQVGIASVP